MRASGLPVNPENLDKYHEEFRIEYDKIDKEYGIGEKSQMMEPLEALEKKLLKKYPNVETWNFAKTQKQWKEMVEEYGPVAVALDQDTGKPVYVIMDVDFGS